MAAIDIGADVIDRGEQFFPNNTFITKANPANLSGLLTSVEIWAETAMTGCRVGTFYTTNGNTLKCRDSVVIGDVPSGSKQTFSSLSITVEAGDYIGLYFAAGKIEAATTGGVGLWTVAGEQIDPDDEAVYSLDGTRVISLYGTGETITPAAPGGSPLAALLDAGII